MSFCRQNAERIRQLQSAHRHPSPSLQSSPDLTDEGPYVRRINGFLDHVDVGDYVVHGNLEAYSCVPLALRVPICCPQDGVSPPTICQPIRQIWLCATRLRSRGSAVASPARLSVKCASRLSDGCAPDFGGVANHLQPHTIVALPHCQCSITQLRRMGCLAGVVLTSRLTVLSRHITVCQH